MSTDKDASMQSSSRRGSQDVDMTVDTSSSASSTSTVASPSTSNTPKASVIMPEMKGIGTKLTAAVQKQLQSTLFGEEPDAQDVQRSAPHTRS